MAFAGLDGLKDIVRKNHNNRLARAIIDLHFLLYWFFIFLANSTGKIPLHTIRNFLYTYFFGLKIKSDSIIYRGCRFYMPGNVTMGHRSVIGYDAFLDARKPITIGQDVNIAGEVAIFTAEHDVNSPTFGPKSGPVVINDWAYIGTRVIILPGVTIGEGAVVASGAVVTKNVKPWTMVGGVPAAYIKDRPVVKYSLDTRNKAYFM